jgi:hypothetical protein
MIPIPVASTIKPSNFSLPRILGVGLIAAVIPSMFMVPMFKLGLSPMPEPPSLEFAEMILGQNLPMPVGLLFHLAYGCSGALFTSRCSNPDLSRQH